MLRLIDNFLNKITMYRLVLYFLIILIAIAMGLGYFGIVSYNPLSILISALLFTILCLIVNKIFAWAFMAPKNSESAYITALILALIISPPTSLNDSQFFIFAFWASVLAMASKYILAIKRKHIFNPAALAVALTALTINQSATWWVGTLWLSPFVFIGGLLVIRKIQRFDLVISFAVAALLVSISAHVAGVSDTLLSLWRLMVSSPLLFFAFIMLSEPLTTPPRRPQRIFYGAFVGFLFSVPLHIGSIYSTPELALIVGNILTYLISPKQKLILKLSNRIPLANNIYDFIFTSNQRLKFKPGQYLEWTLDRRGTDSRGNRRYFTIASSPTEEGIGIGVKFYPRPSTFKEHLLELKKGDTFVASQLAGEFVLPTDKKKKLVFIAGGIGITPFRSMLKYLVDKNEKRDIILFYSNRQATDTVYKDILNQAADKLNIQTIYATTDPNSSGFTGAINEEMIKSRAPDYRERYFYISGPHSMTVAFEKTLKTMGIKKSQIKIDFFPGFA